MTTRVETLLENAAWLRRLARTLVAGLAAALLGAVGWLLLSERQSAIDREDGPGEPAPLSMSDDEDVEESEQHRPVLSDERRQPVSQDPAAADLLPSGLTWRLAGRITDPDDLAVENAEVLWSDVRQKIDREKVARSDADGRYAFLFNDLEEASRPRAMAVRHPGFLTRQLSLALEPGSFVAGTATVDVQLERGNHVRFLVTDELGHPVPEAKVRLTAMHDPVSEGTLPYNPEDWKWRDWRAVFRGASLATGWTNSSGECVLDGVCAGPNDLIVWSQGYLPEKQSPLEIIPGSQVVHTVVLERGQVARGVVVDPDGSPVEGAGVYCCLASRWSSSATREDGTFEIGGLSPTPGESRASYSVVHPDFAPFWCGRLAGEDRRLPLEGACIVLDRGRTVELRLVNEDTGLPVQGPATIETERVTHKSDGPVRESTPPREIPLDHGWMRAERVGRFVRELWLSCPGHDTVRLRLADPSTGAGETIYLRPSRAWTLELVDAESGAPVLGGDLHIDLDTSSEPDDPRAVGFMITGELAPDQIDGNRITMDSSWLRWTDRWKLRVNAPGYSSWERETTSSEMRAGPDVIQVRLERP